MALLVAIMGIWGFGLHMTWQLRTLDIDDAENCLRLFRANRDAGFLPILGFIAAASLQLMLSFA